MELGAAALRIRRLREMRADVDEERDRAIARRAARKFCIELRNEKPGRRKPRIVRVESRPLPVRILGEKEQMLRIFGEQLVGFVAFLELHCLVTNPQRAHVQSAEIAISGSAARRRKKREDCGDRKNCPHCKKRANSVSRPAVRSRNGFKQSRSPRTHRRPSNRRR